MCCEYSYPRRGNTDGGGGGGGGVSQHDQVPLISLRAACFLCQVGLQVLGSKLPLALGYYHWCLGIRY